MNPIDDRLMGLRELCEYLQSELDCDPDNDDLSIQLADLKQELREVSGEAFAYKPPSMSDCEVAIGIQSHEWPARCHEIAIRLLRALDIPGIDQYGFYYGPIVEGSVFYPSTIARHGWLLLDDKRVFDPTRWAFDSPNEPYIYCVSPDWSMDIEYDFGMNRYKQANLKPPPSVGAIGGKWEEEIILKLDGVVRDGVRVLFDDIPLQPVAVDSGVIVLTRGQVMWLANYPYHLLGELSVDVYNSIVDVGMKSAIPIDNYCAAMGTTPGLSKS